MSVRGGTQMTFIKIYENFEELQNGLGNFLGVCYKHSMLNSNILKIVAIILMKFGDVLVTKDVNKLLCPIACFLNPNIFKIFVLTLLKYSFKYI